MLINAVSLAFELIPFASFAHYSHILSVLAILRDLFTLNARFSNFLFFCIIVNPVTAVIIAYYQLLAASDVATEMLKILAILVYTV